MSEFIWLFNSVDLDTSENLHLQMQIYVMGKNDKIVHKKYT